MDNRFRLAAGLQRHLTLIYVGVAAALMMALYVSAIPDPTLMSAWLIAQGVAIAWIGSEHWDGRERWAVRLQISVIAVYIITLIIGAQSTSASAGGLMVFLIAVTALHVAHILSQTLYVVLGGLTTIKGFSRIQGIRQVVFMMTFVAPAVLLTSPGPIGVIFLSVLALMTYWTAANAATRRLNAGLVTEGE